MGYLVTTARSVFKRVVVDSRAVKDAFNGDHKSMTDDEIKTEIAKQIQDTLERLAIKLRETAHEHAPVIRKVLNLTADQIETLH
jgi:hypothetical protein